MELAQAEAHLRECLRGGSRLSKALTDIQEIAGYGDPTRRCAKAVGEILGWFHFEVLSPLERQFPQFADWSFSNEDGSPEFTPQSELQQAFAAFDRAACDCTAVGRTSLTNGIVSPEAANTLTNLVEECRSAGRAARGGNRLTGTMAVSYRLLVIALVVSVTSIGCDDFRYQAALDSAVRDQLTEKQLSERLNMKFEVYDRTEPSWEHLQTFLAREPASNFVPLREAVKKYPRILYHTTAWTMTWIFIDEQGIARGYFLSSQ